MAHPDEKSINEVVDDLCTYVSELSTSVDNLVEVMKEVRDLMRKKLEKKK